MPDAANVAEPPVRQPQVLQSPRLKRPATGWVMRSADFCYEEASSTHIAINGIANEIAESVASRGQVVDRTEQDYGVGLIRIALQPACVSLADAGEGKAVSSAEPFACLLQVERHRVYQVHLVTACSRH